MNSSRTSPIPSNRHVRSVPPAVAAAVRRLSAALDHAARLEDADCQDPDANDAASEEVQAADAALAEALATAQLAGAQIGSRLAIRQGATAGSDRHDWPQRTAVVDASDVAGLRPVRPAEVDPQLVTLAREHLRQLAHVARLHDQCATGPDWHAATAALKDAEESLRLALEARGIGGVYVDGTIFVSGSMAAAIPDRSGDSWTVDAIDPGKIAGL